MSYDRKTGAHSFKVGARLLSRNKAVHIGKLVCNGHIRQGHQYIIPVASACPTVEDGENTGIRFPADAPAKPLTQFDEHTRHNDLVQIAVEVRIQGLFIFVGSQIKLDKFITLIEMDFIVLDWYSQIIQ